MHSTSSNLCCMSYANKIFVMLFQVDAYSDDVIKFEDVELMVKKFGSVLAKRGIQNQDVVAVCVSNTIYYPALIMGVSALNAITTPCNPNYTKGEIICHPYNKFSLPTIL